MVTFHRAYEGGYSVKVNGAIVGYIDRLLDGSGWTFEGRLFQYLSEAKDAVKADRS